MGVMRGDSGQDPSWSPRQSLAPGWGRGRLNPNAGPAALVRSPLTKLPMGQASGTALPPRTLTRRHAGTLSYHNVKIKGWERRGEKKSFPVFAAGDPGNTGWSLCPRRGPFGIKGEQHGGWWLQGGDIHRDYVQRRGCPHSAPNRAELAHGGGVNVGGTAPLRVSPPDPLLRVPQRARGRE